MLELVESVQRLDQRHLNQIAGVTQPAGTRGESSVSDSLECGEITRDELLAGAVITTPRARQENCSRIGLPRPGRSLGSPRDHAPTHTWARANDRPGNGQQGYCTRVSRADRQRVKTRLGVPKYVSPKHSMKSISSTSSPACGNARAAWSRFPADTT